MIKKAFLAGIIATGILLLVIKIFFIGIYRVPQNGMYPGLRAGSRVFTSRHAYSDVSAIKHGDIIVFIREEDGQRYNYIWRVIALPGEKVEASGESLAINGHAVERQRLREADGHIIFGEKIGGRSYEIAIEPSPRHLPPDVSITVPPGQLFVMGDNRFDARDSRYFGPVPFTSVIGKKF
jgi:signal peptidase I